MKKMKITVIALMIAAALATPAMAHGSRHARQRAVSYSVCTTQSCTLTSLHRHSGTVYAGHYYGDGHDYHGYCEVTDCTTLGYHGHDGAYCFGRTAYTEKGYSAGRCCH